MKKVIIKTAIITLASIIAFCILLGSVFLVFMPNKVADFYQSVGEIEKTLEYREKAFNKLEDSESLKLLLIACVNAKNDEKLINYFTVYTQSDNLIINKSEIVSVAGNYCVALSKKGETEKALKMAGEYSLPYSKTVPYRHLIAYAIENKNEPMLQTLLQELITLRENNKNSLTQEELMLLNLDILSLVKHFEKD